MSLPEEEPRKCEFCGKQAIGEYTYKRATWFVCATHSDQQKAQEAFYDQYIQIIELGEEGKYDEALACLNAILEANRHLDHDLWLARAVASERASLLYDAGRYEESLQARNEKAQLGFEDGCARWVHSSGVADALSALGRDREALAAVEDALGYEDPKNISSALGSLVRLARLSEKLGQPVDPKWLGLSEAVAKYHGIDMPAHDSLAKAILALKEKVASMPERPHPG
jgi:tetratricopeptide (TPR) repeat protein